VCIHRPARAADTPAGPQGRAPKFARRCSWVGSHESGPLDRLEGMYVGPAAESSRANKLRELLGRKCLGDADFIQLRFGMVFQCLA
jgi:hypothetical protein